MASFLTTVAFCVCVAFAQRPRPSECPKEVETITTTGTYRGTSTFSDYSTVTEPAETWTRTLDSYNATVTKTVDDLSPNTETVTLSDTTVTSFVATTSLYTYTCDNTITTSQESTRTVYTGSYSSSLAPFCSTSTSEIVEYEGGVVTETGVRTVVQPVFWTEEYIPAGTLTRTSYASTATETATSTEWSSGTATKTLSTSCTSTIYTATASAATTQTAKCAPKNLEANVEFLDYKDSYELMHYDSIREGEAVKDASSCCQVCQDEDDCVALIYNEGWSCEIWRGNDGQCPRAFVVQKGKPGWGDYMTVAAGCGNIEEEFPFVRQ